MQRDTNFASVFHSNKKISNLITYFMFSFLLLSLVNLAYFHKTSSKLKEIENIVHGNTHFGGLVFEHYSMINKLTGNSSIVEAEGFHHPSGGDGNNSSLFKNLNGNSPFVILSECAKYEHFHS